ncbi:hypothetical protein EYF80_042094 [Liparis tanakae]|uniref:Uncharacterized protein n=1 Tax=Liparis tanakae TaxID=230148 RepID=A0A4Z2G2H7_9TELE|nr:hypothetical protein EYF80_042094 [Liparis tanakae]
MIGFRRLLRKHQHRSLRSALRRPSFVSRVPGHHRAPITVSGHAGRAPGARGDTGSPAAVPCHRGP